MAHRADRTAIEEIVARYAHEVGKRYSIYGVYLYGSHARGMADGGSDIDVAVVSEDFSGDPVDDMLALMKLRRGIDLRIEPRPFPARDFTEANPLAREVMKTGIRIL